MIESIVTVVHVLTCLALILTILLQSGKGGGVSAAFGGGAGAALGQRSAATVLGKFTAGAAAVFMVTSMLLAIFSTPSARDRTLDDVNLPAKTAPAAIDTTAPAADTPAPADSPAVPANDAPPPAANTPAVDAPAPTPTPPSNAPTPAVDAPAPADTPPVGDAPEPAAN